MSIQNEMIHHAEQDSLQTLLKIKELCNNSSSEFIKEVSLDFHDADISCLYDVMEKFVSEFESISYNYTILYDKYITLKNSVKTSDNTNLQNNHQVIISESNPTPKRTSFKYNDTPSRKRKDRSKMHGATCSCCSSYYTMMKESPLPNNQYNDNELSNSRHRYISPPPSTPPGYWDIGFSDNIEQVDDNKM